MWLGAEEGSYLRHLLSLLREGAPDVQRTGQGGEWGWMEVWMRGDGWTGSGG